MTRSRLDSWWMTAWLGAFVTAVFLLVGGTAGAADPGSAKPQPSQAAPPAPRPPQPPAPAIPGIPAPRALPSEGRPPSRDLGGTLEDRRGLLPSVMISRISHDGSCPRVGDTLTLTGRGFGASQGRQRVMMRRAGVDRRYDMPVESWSEGRIEARIPMGPVRTGATYVVELRDASGRWFAAGSPIQLCETPGKLQVLVQSSPDCSYDVSDVRVFAVAGDGHRTELGPPTGGLSGPGVKEARLPLGEYELKGEFSGARPTCPGALTIEGTETGFVGWSSNPERIVLTTSRPLGEATLRYGAKYPWNFDPRTELQNQLRRRTEPEHSGGD